MTVCWTLYSRELVETPPWRSWPYGCIQIKSILKLFSCDKSDHNWSCMFKTNTVLFIPHDLHVCIMLYIHLHKYMQSVFCTLSTAYIELYTVEMFNQIMHSIEWFGGWGIACTWRVSYIRTMSWLIAPYSMCRSIMCKEVSSVWVPLVWGGWVYTYICVLNTCNIIILYSILCSFEWVEN